MAFGRLRKLARKIRKGAKGVRRVQKKVSGTLRSPNERIFARSRALRNASNRTTVSDVTALPNTGRSASPGEGPASRGKLKDLAEGFGGASAPVTRE